MIEILFSITANIEIRMINSLIKALKNQLQNQIAVDIIDLDSWYRRNLKSDKINCLRKKIKLIDDNTSESNVWESDEIHQQFINKEALFQKRLEEYLQGSIYTLYINMGDNGLYEAEAINLCNRHKIPTIFISHGYTPKYYCGLQELFKWYLFSMLNMMGMNKEKVRPYALNGCRYIYTINDDQTRYVKRRLLLNKHIYNCGYVYMDILYEYIHKRKDLKPCRNSILVASSDFYSFQKKKHLDLCRAIQNISESFEVTVLLKPGENIRRWDDLAENGKVRIIENPYFDEDLYAFIDDFDIVIATHSQILFEAYLMSKKVIHLDFDGVKDPFGLVEAGQAMFIRKPEEAKSVLDSVASSRADTKKREMLIRKNIRYFDGKCAERIAKSIIEIIGLNNMDI